ncbi:hypothetical protein ACFO25_13575 [Paenactinomyces guangxiensis]|uniref:Uncharacterized protein n=1 Tax=Paenactinomyces guangxiensis TaxID=1490290 RepID=A0A7W2A7F1_9BACL|nr:hypothetical protein [Paenactinomyces guangxiensis]MBA4493475.1 hypothetical protein [Paenactinomyces guangxiensis]MBH8590566.1 hypothetical protein [Paenactinomyces guangxiensis]
MKAITQITNHTPVNPNAEEDREWPVYDLPFFFQLCSTALPVKKYVGEIYNL